MKRINGVGLAPCRPELNKEQYQTLECPPRLVLTHSIPHIQYKQQHFMVSLLYSMAFLLNLFCYINMKQTLKRNKLSPSSPTRLAELVVAKLVRCRLDCLRVGLSPRWWWPNKPCKTYKNETGKQLKYTQDTV